jgi:hypothetical protein
MDSYTTYSCVIGFIHHYSCEVHPSSCKSHFSSFSFLNNNPLCKYLALYLPIFRICTLCFQFRELQVASLWTSLHMPFGEHMHSLLLSLYLRVELLGNNICICATLTGTSGCFSSSACIFKEDTSAMLEKQQFLQWRPDPVESKKLTLGPASAFWV